MFGFLKARRHAELRQKRLTDDERAIVARAVHLWDKLDEADRREIEGHVQVFLAEKSFEGAGGLVMTDEIRLTIAAEACLLLLHGDGTVYPDLDSIVVYPHPFVVEANHRDGPVVVTGREVRLGESWTRGLVILAWDEVERDVRAHHSGRNVVVHEFAHQLDAADGAVDGAPRLGSASRYAAWAHVFGEAYQALGERLRRGLPSDIDAYGATSPAEFFAVVSEAFFERGDVLRNRHPALYAELAAFYRIDPATLLAS